MWGGLDDQGCLTPWAHAAQAFLKKCCAPSPIQVYSFGSGHGSMWPHRSGLMIFQDRHGVIVTGIATWIAVLPHYST
jgi:hypothetical protein